MTSMLIARPISWLSPWFSGCRQLAWKGWDRGRDNRLQGHIRSGPRSCHWQKRRHRRRCLRRRDGPGTWLSFGIAQEIGSITSVPFGEKENFRDASPRVLARGPRRASLCPDIALSQQVLWVERDQLLKALQGGLVPAPLVVNSTGGHPPLELKPTQDPGREHHFNLVQGRWLQFSQLGYVPYRDVQFAGADGDWDNCPTSREELVGNGRITYYTDLN